MHKVAREDDKLFNTLLVPITLSKYILAQGHDALGHTVTARTYPYLNSIYYWKKLNKDVDAHVKQCIKCRNLNLHLTITHNYTWKSH